MGHGDHVMTMCVKDSRNTGEVKWHLYPSNDNQSMWISHGTEHGPPTRFGDYVTWGTLYHLHGAFLFCFSSASPLSMDIYIYLL